MVWYSGSVWCGSVWCHFVMHAVWYYMHAHTYVPYVQMYIISRSSVLW